jgi:phosphoethanolamine N-methyltransferase
MSKTNEDTDADGQIHYTDRFTAGLEISFGEGFLSPGGQEEVAKIVKGIDFVGMEVLDIGVGLAQPACLLVEEHGAAHVTGIDVETPVLKRAAETVKAHGLEDSVILRLVEPGPLPFADESFDIVFSKDAIIHIPDTEALFNEIHRVLRPGGWVAVGDWYCSNEPFTKEMSTWVELLGLDFAMKPIEISKEQLGAAGFVDVESLDRNAWYTEVCRDSVGRIRGPQYATYVEVLGEDGARNELEIVENELVVTLQGQLRPGHLRGRKPEI